MYGCFLVLSIYDSPTSKMEDDMKSNSSSINSSFHRSLFVICK